MLHTDMMGRTVRVVDNPRRIISLVPSQTELLYDLGLSEELVGLTKFCVHPDEWFRTKTRVGGTKSLHIAQILNLNPDLVIGNKEENLQSEIYALEQHVPVWMSDIYSLEDALVMIRSMGVVVGKAERAQMLADEVAQGFSRLYLPEIKGKKVAYLIWNNPIMVAAANTFIDDILGVLGMENVFTGLSRYPECSLEDIKNAAPDFILLSSEPYPFKERHLNEFREAVPRANVLLVDGEMFSWYGSRLRRAPAYFESIFATDGR